MMLIGPWDVLSIFMADLALTILTARIRAATKEIWARDHPQRIDRDSEIIRVLGEVFFVRAKRDQNRDAIFDRRHVAGEVGGDFAAFVHPVDPKLVGDRSLLDVDHF